MADLGADVIKIEDPTRPEELRASPPLTTAPDGEWLSGSFLYLNTSKKSVGLDSHSVEGRSLLRRIITKCDLVVESLGPERLESLGIAELIVGAGTGPHQGLVATSVSDFGWHGPYSQFLGTEIVVEALSGWMYGLGDPDREPRRTPGSHGRVMAGIFAFIASVAAVHQSRESGIGQRVEISAMEAVLWAQMNITTTYEYSGEIWRRHGDRSPMSHPQGLYECKDGLIGVNVLYYAEWDRFPEFIGRPELLEDERFTTPIKRARHAKELDAIIEPWLKSRTRAELYRLAQEKKIPFALVNSPKDLLASRQLLARDFWLRVPHPSLGEVVVPSTPFRMGDDRWGPRWPAPALGQDNEDVIASLAGQGDLLTGATVGTEL